MIIEHVLQWVPKVLRGVPAVKTYVMRDVLERRTRWHDLGPPKMNFL
jgi:hypothetical protein